MGSLRRCAAVLAFLAVTASVPPVHAASGDLDTSFYAGGFVPYGSRIPRAMAAVPTGGLVVSTDDGGGRPLVQRFTAGGALDLTFSGDGGAFVASPTGWLGEAKEVLLDGSRTVVVGTLRRTINEKRLFVARFAWNGAPDAGFSGDGYTDITLTPYGYQLWVADAHRFADGRIQVIVGTGNPSGIPANRYYLLRYLPSGALDPTVSVTGVRAVPGSPSAVAITPSGRYFTLTRSGNGAGGATVLRKFRTDAKLDTSFSGDGQLTTKCALDGYSSTLYPSITVDPLGRPILWCQTPRPSSGSNVSVHRFTLAGGYDTKFSGNGRHVLAFTNVSSAMSLAVDPKSRVIVTGSRPSFPYAHLELARLNAWGALDPTFSGDGRTTVQTGASGMPGPAPSVAGPARIFATIRGTGPERYNVVIVRQ